MKEYTVMIGGHPHTVQLTPEEAERRGAVEVSKPVDVELPDPKAAATPANKARSVGNKGADAR